MKIIGIDFGTKRMGLAISDESLTLARELEIVSPSEVFDKLEELIPREGITELVLGYPLNMSGEETPKTREVLMFKEKLEKRFQIPIHLVDERLSSAMAEQLPGGMKDIDSLAAQIILQNYLDKQKNNQN